MQRIINNKIKKARARKEFWERWKTKFQSKKVIKAIQKQYKKTGSYRIELDAYKFNEDKLVKVLNMLQNEKQLTYTKYADVYIINLTESRSKFEETQTQNEPIKTTQNEIKNENVQQNVQPNKPSSKNNDDVLKF